MPSLNKEEFLGKVLRQIRFPFDRAGIKAELSDHISERVEHYLELGYDQEHAEQSAVSDMGDPIEIGVELNKEHRPLLGWLWKATGLLVGLVIVLNALFVVPVISMSLSSGHKANIPESEIVYEVAVGETVRLDDRLIHFSKVIYDRAGNLYIFHENHDVWFRGGWSLGSIGTISDDLGNRYWSGGGGGTGGLRARAYRMVEGFSPQARVLYIKYDQFNRKYEVRVPLPVGDGRE